MSSPSKRKAPIFSTSPQSMGSEPPQSFQQLFRRETISPSLASEIDVVLDDGSLDRRRVSLTSLNEAQEEWTPLLAGKYHPLYLEHRSPATSDSSSSGDDDDSSSDESDRQSVTNTTKRWWKAVAHGVFENECWQRVLKCSFAYFIASLFTFVPVLNAFIGHNRTSSHLVATATVFFNPAKTLGGMVEAAAYGWGYVLFALTICLGSMVTTDYFVDRNLYQVAHAMSLLVWLAGASWTISFFKAHWNKPPVATASSLCFIIIFIIVVREGSANKGDFDLTRIREISSAVATGTVITVLCCLIFWPRSAVTKLRKDIDSTLVSYRILLKLLTKTFLLDNDLPEFEANRDLQSAIELHRASFTALQKSLQEAKLEMYFRRDSHTRIDKYEEIIGCMHRLAQYVGGLRSSCGLQFEHISRTKPNRRAMSASLHKSGKRSHSADGGTWNVRAGFHRRRLQDEMRRQKTMILDNNLAGRTREQHQEPLGGASLIEFIHTIRQPLKSLAFTCKRTIYQLQEDFGATYTARKTIPRQKLKSNMIKAIDLFEAAERKAVARLYRGHHVGIISDSSSSTFVPSEDTLLVYFFLFNMLEFARELMQLVEAVDHLSHAHDEPSLSRWHISFSGETRNKREEKVRFIPNERHMHDTLHTPIPKTPWRHTLWRVWMFAQRLRQQKVRYATKAMVSAILLATPAFLESTGAWFREWRMEWALITLMVVMTPTVGGTNLVAIYRIFSTILGVSAATIFYRVFPANIYVLPVLTWLFSIPNFWVILNHKHGKFGQFTLLAYNLVMLNKYNDRETNRIEVEDLALQRFIAIMVGVVVGFISTSYFWPYEARVELRKGLSDLLIQLGWVYRRLVSTYSAYDGFSVPEGRLVPLTHAQEKEIAKQSFMDLELDIQRKLTELSGLLAQAPNEFRLKGPFPTEKYQQMLRSCRNIADKFLAMRTVIFKDAWIENVHQDFILPVSRQRREMAGNILLYFYLLASALRLKTPLPPQLPPARAAWKTLLQALKELPIGKSKHLLENDHVYMFYYAYVTMMEDVIRELDKLGDNMKDLFGSLIPHREWDLLFDTP
ncbi:Fusaric acid resistance protein-like-domain-containing protein [Dichotomocladium elegans]|nr:Fusaric acid resistance protein-like-domain-containing protein [Dichotomocladium elegans]